VEIGSDWLKIAQFKSSAGGVGISALHLEKIAEDGSTLTKSIADAFKKQRLATASVIACLPRQMVNIRMLELPSTDSDEIADMVDLQIGKQTPYSRDEIASAYRIMGSGREGYTRVMLAIVQRSVLRKRFFVLEEAGLDVARMSVSSEGILNWCSRIESSGEGETKAIVLLDVDSFYSDFSVVSNGSLVFTRSILIGANQLLGDYEKWKEKLAQEVKRSLETCRGECPGLEPEKLLVTGAGPQIEESLPPYLAESLNIPSEAVDCAQTLARLPRTPDLRDPAYRAVSLTPLIGIGMSPGSLGFDLVPDSVRLRKGLVEKARNLSALGMLVLTALISASLYATVKFFLKKQRLDRLRSEFAQTAPTAREVERQLEIIKVVGRRQDAGFDVINLLAAIQRLVPADVYFDSLEVDLESKRVMLGGTSGERKDIRPLIKGLEQSSLLRNIREDSDTGQDPKTKRYRFQVACELETRK